MKNRKHPAVPNSILVYANHVTIAHGKGVGEYHVMSRMLLWCRGGEGTVTVNGETFILRHGDMMFLPWGHRIRYLNTSKEPWRISGIHLIPELPPGSPFEYKVKHLDRESVLGGNLRRDADLGNVLKGVLRSRLVYPSPLAHLAEYIVELFTRGNQTERQSRLLAELLLREIEHNVLNPLLAPSAFPLPLEKICALIDGSLQDKITLRDLSKAGGGSPATVCRLFSKHMGIRPFVWINKKRIEMAAELLLSTDLRIGEIAVKVGIPDYYYFSKLFSRFKGVSAGEFRKENSSLI